MEQSTELELYISIVDDQQSSNASSAVSQNQGVQHETTTGTRDSEQKPHDISSNAPTYEDLNEDGNHRKTTDGSELSMAEADNNSTNYGNYAVCCAEFR